MSERTSSERSEKSARLWEIEPYYQAIAGRSFADIGVLFDSIYVFMYKSPSTATCAFLLSNDPAFIDPVKIWQRWAGGNAYNLSYYWIGCQRTFNEHIGTFAGKRDKMISMSRKVLEATAAYRAEDGAPIVQFTPSMPTCCSTQILLHGFIIAELVAARDDSRKRSEFKSLKPKMSMERLLARYKLMTTPKFTILDQTTGLAKTTDLAHPTECMIVPATEKLEDEIIVDADVELCKALFAVRGLELVLVPNQGSIQNLHMYELYVWVRSCRVCPRLVSRNEAQFPGETVEKRMAHFLDQCRSRARWISDCRRPKLVIFEEASWAN